MLLMNLSELYPYGLGEDFRGILRASPKNIFFAGFRHRRQCGEEDAHSLVSRAQASHPLVGVVHFGGGNCLGVSDLVSLVFTRCPHY